MSKTMLKYFRDKTLMSRQKGGCRDQRSPTNMKMALQICKNRKLTRKFLTVCQTAG